MSADAMGALDNRLGVYNVRTAEQNLRNRHQQRGLIDGREKFV